jgi:hypothetical protein
MAGSTQYLPDYDTTQYYAHQPQRQIVASKFRTPEMEAVNSLLDRGIGDRSNVPTQAYFSDDRIANHINPQIWRVIQVLPHHLKPCFTAATNCCDPRKKCLTCQEIFTFVTNPDTQVKYPGLTYLPGNYRASDVRQTFCQVFHDEHGNPITKKIDEGMWKTSFEDPYGGLVFNTTPVFVSEANSRAPKECKNGTNCPNKNCYYSHPEDWDYRNNVECKFGLGCTNSSCVFWHPDFENSSAQECSYGLKCKNASCGFAHPNEWDYRENIMCGYGSDCDTIECPFKHPEPKRFDSNNIPVSTRSPQMNIIINARSKSFDVQQIASSAKTNEKTKSHRQSKSKSKQKKYRTVNNDHH